MDAKAWVASLPGHLQFNEENLESQVAMFDTSSNSGAWCYCFIHAIYPCAYLALLEVRAAAAFLLLPLIPLFVIRYSYFLPNER